MNNNTKNIKGSKKISEVKDLPKKQFSDTLSQIEIIDLLDGFEETSFLNLKRGYLCRYFSEDNKTGKLHFRLGATITHINYTDGYVVLNNGRISWSIQKTCIFWQQLPISEIKKIIEDQYKNTILKKDDEIQIYDKLTKNLSDEIKELNKIIKQLKKIKK